MPDPNACQVYSGWFPHVWFSWNVDDLKKQLAADLAAANVAATTCQGIDRTLLAQWSVFYAGAYAWTQSSSSFWAAGRDADHGQSLQCELYAWQQKLASAKCQIAVVVNPNPVASDAGSNAVKWVGVAAASVAGAYVVSQVAVMAAGLLKARKR